MAKDGRRQVYKQQRDEALAELEAARKALEDEQEQTHLAREGHAQICRGIKKVLGLEHWPIFGPGVVFQDGVFELVRKRIADLEEELREAKVRYVALEEDYARETSAALSRRTRYLPGVLAMKDFYEGSFIVEQDGKLRRKRHDTDYICDFCCQPLGETCWTYPCGEMELPLAGDPTGLTAMSDDSWACCLECHPLVQAKDWKNLSEMSLMAQLVQIGAERYYLHLVEHGSLEQIEAHFERFDAARLGEPYQEHAPYRQHK